MGILSGERFVAVAVGAVSSLAEGALPTAMLLRTGASGVTPTVREDAEGAPLLMGYVPTIDAKLEGEDRAAAIADVALEECAGALVRDLDHARRDARARGGAMDDVRRAGLAVTFEGAADALPGVSSPIGLRLGARLGRPIARDASVTRPRERPAPAAPFEVGPRKADGARDSIALLSEALGWLTTKQADVVFWGATHTDWATPRLRALEAQSMLYRLTALDAVIPGEGAAFLAWMTADRAERAGLRALAELRGTAVVSVDLDDPVDRLDGFARASRSAAPDDAEIGWILSDLTFEAQDQLEWEAMVARAGPRIAHPFLIDNPCRRIGQLGCASTALYASSIAASWGASHVPSPSALVLGRGPGGRRSALWLTKGLGLTRGT